jgi:hypothetical protein
MVPLQWPRLLTGLAPVRIQANMFTIPVKVLGKVEVGPYNELLAYVKKPKLYVMPVNVHHIVNGEHLEGTGWEYNAAPCVVLSKITHEQYHGRFNETLPEYHSRSEAGRISRADALGLYHAMFEEETGWRELWTISARILTASVRVPHPRSFLSP